MSIETVTHINFRGQARDALHFYRHVFGGDVTIVTHEQAYGTQDAAATDLVAWGQTRSPAGFAVMAFDVPADRPWDAGISPYLISVRGSDAEEIRSCWTRLGEGGTVLQPLAPSAWATLYGMVTDRFGVTWVLDVPVAPPA